MSSTYEGFPWGAGSNGCRHAFIAEWYFIFQEQCEDTAAYFSLNDDNSLPQQLAAFDKKKEELEANCNKRKNQGIWNILPLASM